MAKTREAVEAQLLEYQDANPDWLSDISKGLIVASFNNRIASLPAAEVAPARTHLTDTIDGINSVPPYRLCVFILCRLRASGFRLVGSAVAVKSSNKNILLTAGHCVKYSQDSSYFCIPQLSYPYNLIDIPSNAFRVDVIACSIASPDIAILRRCDGEFVMNCPDIMPIGDLPWNKNPSGWGGTAYVYHVPLEVIDNAMNDEAGSPDVVGDVDNVTLHMPSRHHFRLRSFERGSSGGAVISSDGRLMGVLAKTQLYGTVTLQGLHMRTDERLTLHSSSDDGVAASKESHEPDEKREKEEEDGWSISATSTAIPEKGSTAVIPSSVNLHLSGSSQVLSLQAFLQEEQPDTKGCELQLKLAEKEGGNK